MTQQISVPFEEKLDEPLAELCNQREFGPTARIPIVIRAKREAFPNLVAQVSRLGGTVRHEIAMLGALAVWLPVVSVNTLARDPSVTAIELEQHFTPQVC